MNKLSKALCSVAAVIGLITGGATIMSETINEPIGQVIIDSQSLGELRISSVALEITGNSEGCRLAPYTCPAGLITNGIGNAHDVPNKTVTLEQVAKDWVSNLQGAEQCIRQVEAQSGKPMRQGQFDALVSFSFNTGCPRFMHNANGSETRIYKYAKAGQYLLACKELPKWVYGGGKKLPGLVTRRGREYARCIEVE
jgi:lysozyme